MGKLLDALRRNVEAGRRGKQARAGVYERNPFAIFGAGAGGPQRDELAWRVVIDWAPIAEASPRYEHWEHSCGLDKTQQREFVKVEIRGDEGGQLRVIAAPEVLGEHVRQLRKRA